MHLLSLSPEHLTKLLSMDWSVDHTAEIAAHYQKADGAKILGLKHNPKSADGCEVERCFNVGGKIQSYGYVLILTVKLLKGNYYVVNISFRV